MTHRTTAVVQYYVQLNEMFQNDRKGIIKGRFKSLNLLDSRNRSLGIGDRHTLTDRHHKQCKMYYDLPCDLPCAASLAGIQPVRPRAQRTSP